jgi:hypothetical protein
LAPDTWLLSPIDAVPATSATVDVDGAQILPAGDGVC